MKRLVSIMLLVFMVLTLVACGPTEKEYTLSISVDCSFDSAKSKQTNVACALVLGSDGKIVAARFDSFESEFALSEGELVAVENISTKVEQGDDYGNGHGMPAGSWEEQAKAFEDYIVGKTLAEVESLDLELVTGCTMQVTGPIFKSLVKKAADSTAKVSFKTAEAITLGFAVNAKITGNIEGGAKVGADYAATVLAGGKVVAATLDSSENEYTLAIDSENEKIVATAKEYEGTKAERGENYNMPNGSWVKQARAYADSAVGKTVSELSDMDTVSDALIEAGCTMEYTTAGYKDTIIEAAKKAR